MRKFTKQELVLKLAELALMLMMPPITIIIPVWPHLSSTPPIV